MLKNIWIVNHYAIECGFRHLDLAQSFVDQGKPTVVITSGLNHTSQQYFSNQRLSYETIAPNLTIVYLRTWPKYGNFLLRFLNMISFVVVGLLEYRKISELFGKPSAVIASSPHPLTWILGYQIAKGLKSKFVVEFRDIWPLSVIEVLKVSKYNPLVMYLGYLERKSYQRADLVVSTMPYANQHINQILKGQPKAVKWIPNGIDTQKVDQVVDSGLKLDPMLGDYLKQYWCCVYAGGIVKTECIMYLAQVAKKLKEHPDIRFAFIGDGNQKAELLEFIQREQLTNVKVFNRVSKDVIQLVMRQAKVGLAAIEDHQIYRYGISMNKMNDYLYAGVPVIFAFNYPNVVQDAKGIMVASGDVDGYVQAVLKVYAMSEEERVAFGAQGRVLIKEQYDTKAIGVRYLQAIQEVSGQYV